MNKTFMVLVSLCVAIAIVVVFQVFQFVKPTTVIKTQQGVAVDKSLSKEALERKEQYHQKITELEKMINAFHDEEKPLRQQLKAATDADTAKNIRARLAAMLKKHHESLIKERARLGLPDPLRMRMEMIGQELQKRQQERQPPAPEAQPSQ